MGSPATRAGSQSLMALCNSFKWPHFGSLNKPEEAKGKSSVKLVHRIRGYIITKYVLYNIDKERTKNNFAVM